MRWRLAGTTKCLFAERSSSQNSHCSAGSRVEACVAPVTNLPDVYAAAMRRLALIVVLLLAGCSDAGGATTTAPPPPLTTLDQATTEPPPPTSTTTTVPATTTTTTTTTLPPGATAEFGLTQVVFDESAFVVITNWGNGPGTLSGHWLCQATSYMALPDIELDPGEQALVGLARTPPPELAGMAEIVFLGPAIGGLAPDFGEIALFDAAAFDDPDHIVAYVQWGIPEQTTSEVAVTAGIWDGGAVEVFDEAPSISSGVFPATSSNDWFADVGG